MDQTARLNLPFILSAQAQKHVTHNEALLALDALVQPVVASRSVASPPASPLLGEAYIVADGAGGAWAGHDREIAVWRSGAWVFHDPAGGWQAYVEDARELVVFQAGAWVALAGNGAGGVPRLGVNASADATNRLAVSSPATLLNHAGAGHQLKLNKAAAGDTASLLFQSNWSGHAEMGLAGDNHWRLKVSPDGGAWIEALSVNNATGAIAVAGTLRPAADNAATLGASGARWSAVWAATGTIQTSDVRQKADIAPSDMGLGFVMALEPVRYRWKDGARPHYGLLAQQVKTALDRLGVTDFAGYVKADPQDPESEEGLRYGEFIAPLIAAVQELAGRVEALERGRG
ncbi:DUF2793 domain-containing protein [Devosia geojensis]|uniref:DUF2793 domain-containing protein n=1 Tax=Devosia geojensis TaxID=443610 RepID=UPI000696A360|nr:DUF2793 domain-containing protein [Devosia geojensis]